MNNIKVENLANLLRRLNQDGVTLQLKKEAMDIVSNIDPVELSIAEQKLIEEGMNPEDLRNLCEVHMEVLSDELNKIKTKIPSDHVIDTLIAEHEKIKGFLADLEKVNYIIQKMDKKSKDQEPFNKLLNLSNSILDAENHHLREENVLFPELEKRGITGPPRIMRMEHDALRLRKKKLKETAMKVDDMDFNTFKAQVDENSKYIIFNLRDHIYKENHILYPTAVERINDKRVWADMKDRCDNIGYCSFTPLTKTHH